jgi:Zn-dependent peptidase ImmA (M78 family)
MPRTPKALVEGSVLKWARTSIGLDLAVAAKRIGVSVTRLMEWEAGEELPTIAQLRKAGAVYKRPLAVFYLSEPPLTFEALTDFRKLPDESQRVWSPELHQLVRRAIEQREAALELVDLLEDERQNAWRGTTARPSDSTEATGGALREMLGVTLLEQQSWRNDRYKALNAWIAAVEQTGVLVLQSDEPIGLGEMRGLSLYHENLPVIVLNGSDAARGKIFTLLHECAHLMLRNGGICDVLPERQPTSAERQIEVACNRIAAAALMPRDDLVRQPSVTWARPESDDWTTEVLAELTRRYAVSEESLIRRLVTIGKASMSFYLARRAFLQERYGDKLDGDDGDQSQRIERGRPRVDYYRLRVRTLGRSYVRMVLNAYDRDLIDTTEAASFLEAKIEQLPKLANVITPPAGAA